MTANQSSLRGRTAWFVVLAIALGGIFGGALALDANVKRQDAAAQETDKKQEKKDDKKQEKKDEKKGLPLKSDRKVEFTTDEFHFAVGLQRQALLLVLFFLFFVVLLFLLLVRLLRRGILAFYIGVQRQRASEYASQSDSQHNKPRGPATQTGLIRGHARFLRTGFQKI